MIETAPLQTEAISELAQIGATYGFPALFALLFWKYIKDVQMKQNEKLRDVSQAVTRIEDILMVEQMNRNRSKDRDDDEQE